MLNEERLKNLFIELAKIQGLSKKESAVSSVLKTLLTNKGFIVSQDSVHQNFNGQCGNIFVEIPGNLPGKAIMLNAHMDTVNTGGEVEPICKDDAIYSAGSTILGADNRAGIAAIIEVIFTLKEQNIPHRSLLLIFTVAEEIGLLGSRYAKLNINKIDFGVVLDTSGPIGTIINKAPYHVQWKIKVHGKSAHAGIEPENGVNAIQLAAKLIEDLPSGRISENCTANIGRIIGGTSINIVAELVTILGEIRSTDKQKLKETLEDLKYICFRFSQTHGHNIQFTSERNSDGYSLSDNAVVIKSLSNAAKSCGLTPLIQESCGGSDANVFNMQGLETAVISCGMRKPHTTEEFIFVKDLIDSAKMVLSLVTTPASSETQDKT